MNIATILDNSFALNTISFGWAEGLKYAGYNVIKKEKIDGLGLKEEFKNSNLFIIKDPLEINFQLICDIKKTYQSSKIVCVIDSYQDIFNELANFVNLWVEPCFYDKTTELKCKEKNLPFLYLPLASLDFICPFYTELNRITDLSTNSDELYNKYFTNYKTLKIDSKLENSPCVNSCYGNTKINLNMVNLKPDFINLNSRTFNIGFSGNFQLSNNPAVIDLFEGKIGYTTYEEMESKIEYYLKNEEDRNRMAIKSYEICIRDHTYTNRIKKLLTYLKI